MQKELVENICEQIRECLRHMKSFSITEDYSFRKLIKLESRHLDLLLDVLESKINIESYVVEYNSLFSNEEFYDSPNVYPSFLALETEQKEARTICIDTEVLCFINILRICSENIKKHITNERYEKMESEIYYNHNVPSLISSKKKDLIKYYLTIECVECKSRCSKEMVTSYEDAWKEASSQFLCNSDYYV